MRPLLAWRIASPARRTSFSVQRAKPATVEVVISAAMADTASKSPWLVMGNPASMMSTPSCSSARAISSFSFRFSDAPGDCSPSRSVVSKMRIGEGWTMWLEFSPADMDNSQQTGKRTKKNPARITRGVPGLYETGRPYERFMRRLRRRVRLRSWVVMAFVISTRMGGSQQRRGKVSRGVDESRVANHPAVKIREVVPAGEIAIWAGRRHRGQWPAYAVPAALR